MTPIALCTSVPSAIGMAQCGSILNHYVKHILTTRLEPGSSPVFRILSTARPPLSAEVGAAFASAVFAVVSSKNFGGGFFRPPGLLFLWSGRSGQVCDFFAESFRGRHLPVAAIGGNHAGNTSAAGKGNLRDGRLGSRSLPATTRLRNDAPSSLNSRSPHAAESPFKGVCTVPPNDAHDFPRRRAFSPASALHRSAPAGVPAKVSKKSSRSSAPRSSGDSVTLSPQSADRPFRCLCDHLKFTAQAQQALRMSHKKDIRRHSGSGKYFSTRAFLFRFIEIHHDVAAEDHIVPLRQVFRLQIVKVDSEPFLSAVS